ncbi:MAG: protein kinase domain-containing protein [Planctomycetia bacterium]
MAEPEPAPEHRTLGGHYRLLRKLGEGAFGEVYAARHELLGQDFAVKLLKPELCSQQEVRDRFLDEARALIRFSHPNVVQLRHVGEQDGRLYLVMDFVRGEPLSELLAREGPLAEARALALVQQVLQGLAAAHAVGIVHRDLKPGNLMVERRADGSERVHILDFGLSKLSAAGEGLESAHRSLSGTIVGTLAYMSPEQLQGQAVDPRSDVFAAGLVLMEMLQGRHPYAGESGIMVAARLLRDPLPPLAPEVAARTSAATRDTLARALERDREARWASATHFAEALKAKGPPSDTSRIATVAEASAALRTLPAAPPQAGTSPQAGMSSQAASAKPAGRRGLVIAGGVLLLAAAGAFAVLGRRGQQDASPSQAGGPAATAIVPLPATTTPQAPPAEARMQPMVPTPEVVPAAPPPPLPAAEPSVPAPTDPAAAQPGNVPPGNVQPGTVLPGNAPQPATQPGTQPSLPAPAAPAPAAQVAPPPAVPVPKVVPPTPQELVARAERELAAGSLVAAAATAREALAAEATSLRALEVLGRSLVGEATRLGRSGRTGEASALLAASATDLAGREAGYQRLQGAEPSLQRQLQGVAAMLRAELHGEAMRWQSVAGKAREAAAEREQAVNAFVFAWQSLENDGLRGLELRLRRAAFRMHVGEGKGALEDLAATTKANNESVPVAMWVAHGRGARLLAEQARQQGRLPAARQYLDEARTVLKNASAWREKDFTQADLLEGLRVQVLAATFEERARELLAVQGAAGFLERRMATAPAPAGEAPEEAQARQALARGALAYVRARLKQAPPGPNAPPAARALAQAELEAADAAADEALRLRAALEARGGPKVPAFAWHLKAEVARARGDGQGEAAARAKAWQAHAANDE